MKQEHLWIIGDDFSFFIFHSLILIVQKSSLLSKIFFKGIGTYLQKVHGIYIKITRIIFKND